MLSLLELSMEVESGLKTKKELLSKLLAKTAKFVSLKEHGSTFMTNLCLSTRDGHKIEPHEGHMWALAAYTPQSFERCSDEVRSKLKELEFPCPDEVFSHSKQNQSSMQA